jgi:hypothetical protein
MSRSRRRRIERRGRPRKANARHRAKTAAARRAPEDLGTNELRRRKILATTRVDLPIDGAAVLYGHAHIDRTQFDTLGMVTEWLRHTARAWGGKDGSVQGLWLALLGAAISTPLGGRVTVTAPGADEVRYRLTRALRRLDGSRNLVVSLAEGRIPPLVVRAVECCLSSEDEIELDRLRAGLDRIAGRRDVTRRDRIR